MATLSSLGVGSGLDAENIVTSLVALERKPAEAVKAENTKLDTKVSTWGKIQSAFSSLQDAANSLNSNDFWTAAKATSSDASTVGVTTSAASAPGVHYALRARARPSCGRSQKGAWQCIAAFCLAAEPLW